jgi:tryptophanyl-tRNA synthetase
MSKSIGNTILLSDSADEIKKKMRTAVTDPLKVRKNDPGRPEVCLIFTYHQKFNATEGTEIDRDCRSGVLGCVDCKMRIANRVADVLAPFREKRAHYESHINEVKDTLVDGETRARTRAQATMSEVHQAMLLG